MVHRVDERLGFEQGLDYEHLLHRGFEAMVESPELAWLVQACGWEGKVE
jgi:hypothetical protein